MKWPKVSFALSVVSDQILLKISFLYGKRFKEELSECARYILVCVFSAPAAVLFTYILLNFF